MLGERATILSAAVIDQYRNWCIGKGQSANTVRAYSTDLRMFLLAAGEDSISLDEYEEMAQGWLNLTRRTAKPKTTQRRLTSLRSFGKWSGLGEVLKDYIPPQPGRAIPHPIPEGFSGVERMIKVASKEEQKALIALCGFAGLRIGEALATRVDWINVSEMLITVRGKGDKTRTVPISERCWPNISSTYVLALQTSVFYGRPDWPLIHYKDSGARSLIRVLGRKAGLQRDISSHDLRMTFGTEIYNHTRDLRVAQELLGHAHSTTTEVYTGVTIDKMRNAINF